MQQTGKYLIIGGLIVLIAGLILYLFGHKLSWLGKLPGDIRIEREGFSFYFPLTTGILISVLITALVKLIAWIQEFFK